MDRISDMPDSVLCHILSFLPTKDAVTSSILCRTWRHLWKHLQVFDFSDSYFEDNSTSFAPFVNSVLARRRTRDFVYFRVSCSNGFAAVDDMESWIRDVAGPHLQELSLFMDPCNDGILSVPLSFFTCRGLVSLSLIGSMCVQGLQLIYLPSLKTLKLDIDYVNPTDIFYSFSGFPVLETLDIAFSRLDAPNIRAPSSLKRLTYANITHGDIEYLDINTPSLEYLNINLQTGCSHLSVINLQNVVEAHLDFHRNIETHFDFILKLLRALTRTEVLVLQVSTVKHLLYAPNLDFPDFEFLLRLELSHPHAVNPEFIVKLLQKCSMLQVLRLRVLPYHGWEEPWSLESWTQPIYDPKCLTSHLINFECRGYQGYASEQAFIAYILQRGLVLKTMTIATFSSLDLKKKYRILKKLAIIPRASNMCQLDFG